MARVMMMAINITVTIIPAIRAMFVLPPLSLLLLPGISEGTVAGGGVLSSPGDVVGCRILVVAATVMVAVGVENGRGEAGGVVTGEKQLSIAIKEVSVQLHVHHGSVDLLYDTEMTGAALVKVFKTLLEPTGKGQFRLGITALLISACHTSSVS